MATKVTTLKNAEKTDNLLPRTELNAIFDSDGNYLDSNLKASDLNALKGGAVDELVRFTEDGAGTPIPTDADTLEGHDASYFATAEAVSSLSDQSSTEVLVGKTYDNHPIYRRHFHGTLSSSTYSSITSDYNSTNNRLIRAEGQLGGVGNNCISVNCYLNSSYFSGMYLNPYGVQIYYSSEYSSKEYDIDLYIAKLN